MIALRRRTRTVRSQQAPAYLPRPGLASVALLLGTCLRRMAKDSRFNEDRSSLVTMLRGRVPYRVIPEYERPVGSCVVRPGGSFWLRVKSIARCWESAERQICAVHHSLGSRRAVAGRVARGQCAPSSLAVSRCERPNVAPDAHAWHPS